ncbi:hypothetical protein K456DRAFT_46191 [Colletotrichum gloeosporioides 23]|nr:hypothetical protein K456DRAFT_46191 [Colletotrichum gloeosporioides 23]
MWEVGTPKGWVITISVSPSGRWWWFILQKAGLPACLLATSSCRCTAAHPEPISHLWQARRLTSIMTAPLSEQARPETGEFQYWALRRGRGEKAHFSAATRALQQLLSLSPRGKGSRKVSSQHTAAG